MTVPSSENAHQAKIVPFQPTVSDNAANPYDERAEPTYVAKLSTPETNEMFPKALNFPGTKHTNSRFIPCIHPTTNVEQRSLKHYCGKYCAQHCKKRAKTPCGLIRRVRIILLFAVFYAFCR